MMEHDDDKELGASDTQGRSESTCAVQLGE